MKKKVLAKVTFLFCWRDICIKETYNFIETILLRAKWFIETFFSHWIDFCFEFTRYEITKNTLRYLIFSSVQLMLSIITTCLSKKYKGKKIVTHLNEINSKLIHLEELLHKPFKFVASFETSWIDDSDPLLFMSGNVSSEFSKVFISPVHIIKSHYCWNHNLISYMEGSLIMIQSLERKFILPGVAGLWSVVLIVRYICKIIIQENIFSFLREVRLFCMSKINSSILNI